MLGKYYTLGLLPQPRIPVTNEGLGWDSLITKNGIILGGDDCIQGGGVVPNYT